MNEKHNEEIKRDKARSILKSWENQLEQEERLEEGGENDDNVSENKLEIKATMSRTEMEDYSIILTALEISQILKISKPTAYGLMNRSDFPLIKIGRCKRVLRDEFFLWLGNHKVI